MKDSMSQYSGIAASYAELPLIALRELESVLQIEIRGRLAAFGVVSSDTFGENSVGDVDKSRTVFSGENITSNGTMKANLKLVEGGLK